MTKTEIDLVAGAGGAAVFLALFGLVWYFLGPAVLVAVVMSVHAINRVLRLAGADSSRDAMDWWGKFAVAVLSLTATYIAWSLT